MCFPTVMRANDADDESFFFPERSLFSLPCSIELNAGGSISGNVNDCLSSATLIENKGAILKAKNVVVGTLPKNTELRSHDK